jgi:transposase-like protein
MNLFKGRHFKHDIIIWAVRWSCKYGISYHDLEEMATERGLTLDHSTIYSWVVFYAPKFWISSSGIGSQKVVLSEKVDETYIIKR